MNAIIKKAHKIRREAAAKFGGKPGQYSMQIACEMAKNGEEVEMEKTVDVSYIGEGRVKITLTVTASGVIAGKAHLQRGDVKLDNPRLSGLYLNARMVDPEGKTVDVSNKIDRDDLRSIISKMNDLKDLTIPGLSILSKARNTRSYEYKMSMRAIDSGSSKCPLRTITDAEVAELERQYPTAAAYLKAENYSAASNDRKSLAGKKAMSLLISGGSVEQANEIMNNWLPAYCD